MRGFHVHSFFKIKFNFYLLFLQYQDPVEVTIPEQLAASYGLYIWPSSPVLAWYIWLHQVSSSTIGIYSPPPGHIQQ